MTSRMTVIAIKDLFSDIASGKTVMEADIKAKLARRTPR
jgi:hypothetical protein